MLGTGGIVCQTHSCCQRGVGSHMKTPLKGLLVAKGMTFKPNVKGIKKYELPVIKWHVDVMDGKLTVVNDTVWSI